MRINNNLMAMNTHRQLGLGNAAGAKSMEKLSSGYRINRAGDDAAGLSISEKMRGQIRGLTMASKNAQDGISLIQTAEGALNETHAILQRMRELAVQASNDTNVDIDRSAIQSEIDELAIEISRIADNTEFNTQKLLDGSFSDKKFHIGANEGQDMSLTISAMGAKDLKVASNVYTAQALTGTGLNIISRTGQNITIEFADAKTGSGHEAVEEGIEVVDNTITITLAQDEYDSSGSSDGAITSTNADIKALLESVADKVGFVVVEATDYDGTASATVAGDSIDLEVWVVDAEADVIGGLNVSSQTAASDAVKTINDAIETVSSERSKLGATQNRLEHTIKNLDTSAENLQAAESRIRDVDYTEAA
jgi:flagellin